VRSFRIFSHYQTLLGDESLRRGWAGHVACVEENRNTYRFLGMETLRKEATLNT
jgi:hypothetical protein